MPLSNYEARAATLQAVQVTAANLAEIATLTGGTVVGSTVEFVQFAAPVVANLTDYVLPYYWTFAVIDADSFVAAYRAVDLTAQVVRGAVGQAVVAGTLGAGSTQDVVVPISPAMPTDAFPATATITATGSTILGKMVSLGVVSTTKTSVTVRVQNTGLTALISTGAKVSVIAGSAIDRP